MDIHKNARLTLRRREDLVQHVSQGVTLKLAAANFQVTPKTAAKWVHRFRSLGPPGRVPQVSPLLRDLGKDSRTWLRLCHTTHRCFRPLRLARCPRFASAFWTLTWVRNA